MPKIRKTICGVSRRQIYNIVDQLSQTEQAEAPLVDQNEASTSEELPNIIIDEEINLLEEFFTVDDHIFNDSEEYSSDEELNAMVPDSNRSRFQIEFTKIMKKHQCSHVLIHDLLLMAKANGHPELPLTAQTLYKISDDQIVEELITKPIGTGQYWHRGIQNAFAKWDAGLFDDVVVIDAFTDGFPIVKSSLLCGWPILGGIVGRPDWPVLLFGIYSGYGSPKSSDELLVDFARESQDLIKNGILIGSKNVRKRFAIRCFLGDAPARSYVLCVKYHSSYNGCTKCEQIGYREETQPTNNPTETKNVKKAIRYQTETGILRTDKSFHDRSDILHHHEEYQNPNNRTVLEKHLNFKMVSMVPIDSMHCIDLGVTRNLLKLMIANKHKRFFFNNCQIGSMEQDFLSYKNHMPDDFSRFPRKFVEIPRFKATECRQFLLYTGPVLLKKYLLPDVYKSFLKYHCGIRLLHQSIQSEDSLDKAQQLLEEFVRESKSFMPTTYNIHNVLHMTNCVRQFGPLESFSNYRYENALFILKKSIKKASQVIQQVKNCLDRDMLHANLPKITNDETFDQMNINL
jgi:hypothetical protein